MAKFADNTPAILYRKHGKGAVGHFAFLPGLSYFAPATPKVPVDRGTTAKADQHCRPAEYDNFGAGHYLQLVDVLATNVAEAAG